MFHSSVCCLLSLLYVVFLVSLHVVAFFVEVVQSCPCCRSYCFVVLLVVAVVCVCVVLLIMCVGVVVRWMCSLLMFFNLRLFECCCCCSSSSQWPTDVGINVGHVWPMLHGRTCGCHENNQPLSLLILWISKRQRAAPECTLCSSCQGPNSASSVTEMADPWSRNQKWIETVPKELWSLIHLQQPSVFSSNSDLSAPCVWLSAFSVCPRQLDLWQHGRYGLVRERVDVGHQFYSPPAAFWVWLSNSCLMLIAVNIDQWMVSNGMWCLSSFLGIGSHFLVLNWYAACGQLSGNNKEHTTHILIYITNA